MAHFQRRFFIGSTQKLIIHSMNTNKKKKKTNLEKFKELVLCGSAFVSDLR